MNAAVHGALSNFSGRLIIEWKMTDNSGGFELIWTEDGVRPQPEMGKPGFGTVMVQAIVEKQLSGRLRRTWKDGGLEILFEDPHS